MVVDYEEQKTCFLHTSCLPFVQQPRFTLLSLSLFLQLFSCFIFFLLFFWISTLNFGSLVTNENTNIDDGPI